MNEHDQLPEHHRAYIRARANVVSCAERSTAALDALVARGVTDAEELPLRERRYLAARGGMLRRGEDPASLDGYVEGVLDDGEAQVPVGHGPDLPEGQADRADQHDLVVGGVVYSATEWESDAEGGVRRIGGDHTQPEAAREALDAETSPARQTQVPRAVRLAGMFGGPMYGPPAPGGTTAHGPQHRQPHRNDQVGGGGTAGHRRGHEPTRAQGQEFGR